jgi:hypothetical protein
MGFKSLMMADTTISKANNKQAKQDQEWFKFHLQISFTGKLGHFKKSFFNLI